jgi:cell division protein FtsW
LGPMTFQPSELAKLSVIILLAWYMARTQRGVREFGRGLFVPLCLLGGVAILILAAPDFGTTMLVGAVGMLIMFAGGTRAGYLSVTAALGGLGFIFLIMQDTVRMRRVLAFLDPDKYAQDEAFQLLSAIYAFVIGGARGVGLGQSIQKRFYLPESHTDFIFAIIGEELGVVASISVVLLFGVLFGCGMFIALRTTDLFGKLLALGITLMITLQASLNMAVVTGLVPTKGLPLPFISYGGSSIVITMIMVGILVNIALNNGEDDEV